MATLVVYKSLRNLVLFVPTWVVVQAFANLHRWAFGIRKHSVIEMLACAFLVVHGVPLPLELLVAQHTLSRVQAMKSTISDWVLAERESR